MQHKLELSERRRVVEQERIRIAQDIHDDMGARLTQISLMSRTILGRSTTDSPSYATLIKIDWAAREVATALDEIVWAVNPAHDTLEGLGNYLSDCVTEIVAENEIRCRLDIPTLLPPRFISSGTRHHLLLAVKELLHNALKHSGATEVRAHLTFNDPTLTITISDNGCGFDPKRPSRGNGLINMQQRLRAVGGTCEITSQPGQGTTTTLTLRLQETPAD
jgi:signal transduction histidine kinase